MCVSWVNFEYIPIFMLDLRHQTVPPRGRWLCVQYEGNIYMAVFNENVWRARITGCKLLHTNLAICVSIFYRNKTIVYDVKLKSVISYWEWEIGKGSRTESWGTPVKGKTLAVMPLSTVNMLAGNWENLRAVLGSIISVHIIKTSKQAKTVANVR